MLQQLSCGAGGPLLELSQGGSRLAPLIIHPGFTLRQSFGPAAEVDSTSLKELSQAQQQFEASVSANLRVHPLPPRSRRAQRKPDTPTQVNDTPRAFPKAT